MLLRFSKGSKAMEELFCLGVRLLLLPTLASEFQSKAVVGPVPDIQPSGHFTTPWNERSKRKED